MLTLIQRTRKVGSNWYAEYQCVCGTIKEIRIAVVNSGSTKSCGCHRKNIAKNKGLNSKTHGKSQTKEFQLWADLHQFCNPAVKKYKGLTICKEWETFEVFDEWYQNNYKEGTTIDWNSTHLSPENCKFIETNITKSSKRKKTNIVRYGVENTQSLESVKQKIKETCLDRYGFESASHTKETKAKTVETSLKKYGVKHHMLLDEYRESARQRTIDNGQAHVIQGKTGSELSKELGFSASHTNFLIRKFGEGVLDVKKRITIIEQVIESILEKNEFTFEKRKIGKYFPDFIVSDLIIEADGLYWHSDSVNKDKKYHQTKKEVYKEAGFRSLFFREHEILNKESIVESIILNKLGKSNKIFARKCIIKKLDVKDSITFCNDNHLMGSGSGQGYGLYYNEELITVMRVVKKATGIDISRFCNKLNTNVVGGFSKLLSFIIKDQNPTFIQTFIDLRYGEGTYLTDLGFNKITEHLSFGWTKNMEYHHRMKFPGSSGYKLGYSKIWDCGQAKWMKELSV